LNFFFQCGPAILYPIWTSLWLLYHLSWLSYDIYEIIDDSENGASYYVNLTNWSYMLLIVTNLTDVICTLYVHCRRTDIFQDSYELGNNLSKNVQIRNNYILTLNIIYSHSTWHKALEKTEGAIKNKQLRDTGSIEHNTQDEDKQIEQSRINNSETQVASNTTHR
jgi:hypothetical protein